MQTASSPNLWPHTYPGNIELRKVENGCMRKYLGITLKLGPIVERRYPHRYGGFIETRGGAN